MSSYFQEIFYDWKERTYEWWTSMPLYVSVPYIVHVFFSVLLLLGLFILSIVDTSYIFWHFCCGLLGGVVLWHLNYRLSFYVTTFVVSPEARYSSWIVSLGFFFILYGCTWINFHGIPKMILSVWCGSSFVLIFWKVLNFSTALPLSFIMMFIIFIGADWLHISMNLFGLFYSLVWLGSSLALAWKEGIKKSRKSFVKERVIRQRYMARHLTWSISLMPLYLGVIFLCLIWSILSISCFWTYDDSHLGGPLNYLNKFELMQHFSPERTCRTNIISFTDLVKVAGKSMRDKVMLRSNYCVATALNSRIVKDFDEMKGFMEREARRICGTNDNIPACRDALCWLIQKYDGSQESMLSKRQARIFYYRIPYMNSGTIKYVALKAQVVKKQKEAPRRSLFNSSFDDQDSDNTLEATLEYFSDAPYKFVDGSPELTQFFDHLLMATNLDNDDREGLRYGGEFFVHYENLQELMAGNLQVVDIKPFPFRALNEQKNLNGNIMVNEMEVSDPQATSNTDRYSFYFEEDILRLSSQENNHHIMVSPFMMRMREMRTTSLQSWIGLVNVLAGYQRPFWNILGNVYKLRRGFGKGSVHKNVNSSSSVEEEMFWAFA